MISSKWCPVRFRAFLATAGCAVPIALAGTGAYGAEVVHGNDEGGLLGEYVEKYRAMAARGDRLVVDGPCYSACTLALGIVDVCTTPRASFGFHMAQSMTLFGYFPSYYWSRYMMAHYPPEIRAWIVSKGGLTPDLKILRGEELAALVPICSSEGEESQSEPESPHVPLVYGSQAVQSSALPPPDRLQQRYDGTQPSYGAPAAVLNEQGATRPTPAIVPGQGDPRMTGSVSSNPQRMAALPPELRPETAPNNELPSQFRRTLVDYPTKEPASTIIIDTPNTYLYLVLGNGKALRYGVGVGREGFTWSGTERVTKMAEWPDWTPPEEMIVRQPYLPRFMAGGETNPLGARALYLGNTVYRIHGTNQPSTIGTFVSSGCIRLTNEDVMDLYTRVKIGTHVVVLPAQPPALAAVNSVASPPGQPRIAPSARLGPVREDAKGGLAPVHRAAGTHNAAPIANNHNGLGDEQKARVNSLRAVAVGTRSSPDAIVVDQDRSRTHERDNNTLPSVSVAPPWHLDEE
jgi:lipoprotein-anchoring transpeptidase ErfK/SrfK